MTHAAPTSASRHFSIRVGASDPFSTWRSAARSLVAAAVPPENVSWADDMQSTEDLFSDTIAAGSLKLEISAAVRATGTFLDLARYVILHRDRGKYPLLYRVLWRLQADPLVLNNPVDPDTCALALMNKQVRRDIHKMRAFVRFRELSLPGSPARFIAWFEPDHHIVRANADFFINRFGRQNWSILTPEISLHWNGTDLTEGCGARREDAPQDDATEALWTRYYASIFNPARLKIDMMTKEMPRRYWKNLPEAKLIPELIAGAQSRAASMVDAGQDAFAATEAPATLEAVAQGISACRACAIGCNGTRAVAGEGQLSSSFMIVGEQPGDTEERAGRPFIGPSGQLLNRHLQRAGIDRDRIWVTNAVKHFKHELRGKKRLHKTPSAREIDHCRWWLDAERMLLRPRVTLALGASAGRALLGRTPSIGRERGQPILMPDGSQLLLTVHPSSILRLNPELQAGEETQFQQDILVFRDLMTANQA